MINGGGFSLLLRQASLEAVVVAEAVPGAGWSVSRFLSNTWNAAMAYTWGDLYEDGSWTLGYMVQGTGDLVGLAGDVANLPFELLGGDPMALGPMVGGAEMAVVKGLGGAANYLRAGATALKGVKAAKVPLALPQFGVRSLNAAKETTTLWRVVGPGALADINATSALRNLGSAEGKYFTTSADAASSYAKQAVRGFGDPPYTLIKTEVPNSIFNGLKPATVDSGIPAWVIPNNRLPGLTPTVLDTMPIPR